MALKEPRNIHEATLWQMLKEGGWELLKSGWPDIIAVKDDRIAVFEVKAKRSDILKETQLRCMGFLSRAGVECYRWDKDSGFLPYNESLPDVKTLNTKKKRKANHTCPICGEQAKSSRSLVCYKCEHTPMLHGKIVVLQQEQEKAMKQRDRKINKLVRKQGLHAL